MLYNIWTLYIGIYKISSGCNWVSVLETWRYLNTWWKYISLLTFLITRFSNIVLLLHHLLVLPLIFYDDAKYRTEMEYKLSLCLTILIALVVCVFQFNIKHWHFNTILPTFWWLIQSVCWCFKYCLYDRWRSGWSPCMFIVKSFVGGLRGWESIQSKILYPTRGVVLY